MARDPQSGERPENEPGGPRSLGDRSTRAHDAGNKKTPRPAQTIGGQETRLGDGDTDHQSPGRAAAEDVLNLSARYEIRQRLGGGGMGEVFRAFDRKLHREVALKRLRGELAASETAVARFLDEARAVAGIDHPGIVRIHDFGRDTEGYYIDMELVEGESLAQALARLEKFAPQAAADIAAQLCDALATAHVRGVVHRDIKPGNILIDRAGRAKLTDFGIARLEETASDLTRTQAVLGTLDYMAPEQRIDPRSADPRSDLWSLAATMYEMVTGDSPRVIRSERIPESLRDVLLAALEDRPDRRPGDALAFKRALLDGAGRGKESPAPEPKSPPATRSQAPKSKTQPQDQDSPQGAKTYRTPQRGDSAAAKKSNKGAVGKKSRSSDNWEKYKEKERQVRAEADWARQHEQASPPGGSGSAWPQAPASPTWAKPPKGSPPGSSPDLAPAASARNQPAEGGLGSCLGWLIVLGLLGWGGYTAWNWWFGGGSLENRMELGGANTFAMLPLAEENQVIVGGGGMFGYASTTPLSLWDLKSEKLVRKFGSGKAQVTAMATFGSASQRTLVTDWRDESRNTRIRVWDLSTGGLRHDIEVKPAKEPPKALFGGRVAPLSAGCLAADASGKTVVAGGPAGTFYVFNAVTGRQEVELAIDKQRVTAVDILPDARFTVAGLDDGRLLLLEKDFFDVLAETKSDGKEIKSVHIARDGGDTLVYAASDKSIRQYVVEKWGGKFPLRLALRRTYGPLPGFIRQAALSPERHSVLAVCATGATHTVVHWDLADDRELETFKVYAVHGKLGEVRAGVGAVAFLSPNRGVFAGYALNGGGTLEVHELTGGGRSTRRRGLPGASSSNSTFPNSTFGRPRPSRS